MWNVQATVEDPKTGQMVNEYKEDFFQRDAALEWGANQIRRFYKTSWSQEVPNINSIVYTEGVGVVGYVNFWEH